MHLCIVAASDIGIRIIIFLKLCLPLSGVLCRQQKADEADTESSIHILFLLFYFKTLHCSALLQKCGTYSINSTPSLYGLLLYNYNFYKLKF